MSFTGKEKKCLDVKHRILSYFSYATCRETPARECTIYFFNAHYTKPA